MDRITITDNSKECPVPTISRKEYSELSEGLQELKLLEVAEHKLQLCNWKVGSLYKAINGFWAWTKQGHPIYPAVFHPALAAFSDNIFVERENLIIFLGMVKFTVEAKEIVAYKFMTNNKVIYSTCRVGSEPTAFQMPELEEIEE